MSGLTKNHNRKVASTAIDILTFRHAIEMRQVTIYYNDDKQSRT